MTRLKSGLVLDGNDIKLRLEAERIETRSLVHVDWVRFTVYRRNTELPPADVMFPTPAQRAPSVSAVVNGFEYESRPSRAARLSTLIKTSSSAPVVLSDFRRSPSAAASSSLISSIPHVSDHGVLMDAENLGHEVCQCLGPDFFMSSLLGKGHDFYTHRLPILRNDTEVGWVGFVTGEVSKAQQAMIGTLHVNISGTACTFALPHWSERLADLIDNRRAVLTRCDLALDFFEGIPRGIQGAFDDHKAGLCDIGGRRLKSNSVGDWSNGIGRSFYIGSKESGKQTNVYEKGHQLFGIDPKSDWGNIVGSNWHRIELRYGNKLRELSPDMLRRPADFFAGASPWHASKLAEHAPLPDSSTCPEIVPCRGRLAVETVNAEVHRVMTWLRRVAAPAVSQAFSYLGDSFDVVCAVPQLPGRLASFSESEIRGGFERYLERLTQSAEPCPVAA